MSLIILLGFILLQIKKYVCLKTPYGDLNFCQVYQGFWQLWHLSGGKKQKQKNDGLSLEIWLCIEAKLKMLLVWQFLEFIEISIVRQIRWHACF